MIYIIIPVTRVARTRRADVDPANRESAALLTNGDITNSDYCRWLLCQYKAESSAGGTRTTRASRSKMRQRFEGQKNTGLERQQEPAGKREDQMSLQNMSLRNMSLRNRHSSGLHRV